MLLRDLLYAFRTLRKSPVFAATAILTITLGIGASTAIFSVTNAVLLRPLPYKNPERLVFASSDMRKRNVKDFFFSNADFLDLRNGSNAVFQEVAAVSTGRGAVPREDGTPDLVHFGNVSTNFFRMMGATTVLGRTFIDSDGTPQPPPPTGAAPGQAPVLPTFGILSYEYWRKRYSGSRDIISKMIPPDRPAAHRSSASSPASNCSFPPTPTSSSFRRLFAARILRQRQPRRRDPQSHRPPEGRRQRGAGANRG